MSDWKRARKTGTIEFRDYHEGEDLTGISVSPKDTPKIGDYIARNPIDPTDQWLISAEFFQKNYEVDV